MSEAEASTSKSIEADENENAEEIPEYTEVRLTETQIKGILMQKFAAKRIINLYIRDLLDPVRVRNDLKLERHFSFGDMVFRNIMVKGVVTEFQLHTHKTKKRSLISVDDGTAVLDCFVEENQNLEDLKHEVQNKQDDVRQMVTLQPDNLLLKASLMMLQSSQERLKKSPHYKDFKLGDDVELIGSLSEYKGLRKCFITGIIKNSKHSTTSYLEELHELYETVYR